MFLRNSARKRGSREVCGQMRRSHAPGFTAVQVHCLMQEIRGGFVHRTWHLPLRRHCTIGQQVSPCEQRGAYGEKRQDFGSGSSPGDQVMLYAVREQSRSRVSM